jgi:hypothetical protein
MKKLPPWFPLAAMVTGAFLLIIAVWITVFFLAKEVNIQPLPADYENPKTPASHSQKTGEATKSLK